MTDALTAAVVGALSVPATVLIRRFFDTLNMQLEPGRIRRLAEAQADAEIVKVAAQIEITQLQERALNRWVAEETVKQHNMEAAVAKALPNLADTARPQDINTDWFLNFFDKCRLTTDDEMQTIWGKILAGEANAPGKYSKRSVNLVASLSKTEAELFNLFSSFAWLIDGELTPIIFTDDNPIYRNQGITFAELHTLDSAGLITLGSQFSQYCSFVTTNTTTVSYFGTSIVIDFHHAHDRNTLPIGFALLTPVGHELISLCNPIPVAGFLDYVLAEWAMQPFTLSSPCKPGQSA